MLSMGRTLETMLVAVSLILNLLELRLLMLRTGVEASDSTTDSAIEVLLDKAPAMADHS